MTAYMTFVEEKKKEEEMLKMAGRLNKRKIPCRRAKPLLAKGLTC